MKTNWSVVYLCVPIGHFPPKLTGLYFLTCLTKPIDVEFQQHRCFGKIWFLDEATVTDRRRHLRAPAGMAALSKQNSHLCWPSGPRKLGAPHPLPNQTSMCQGRGFCPSLHRAEWGLHTSGSRLQLLHGFLTKPHQPFQSSPHLHCIIS